MPVRLRRLSVQKIRRHVRFLRIALNALDESTERSFWRPEGQVTLYPAIEKGRSPFGHTIRTVEIDEKRTAYWYIQKPDHFEALDILDRYSELALEWMPRGKPGRGRRESVRMWVVNVIRYWEEFLNRRFTIDYQKGQPVSEAVRFCVEAFRRVDSRVSAQELITAMRHEQKRIRRRARSKPPA